MIHPLLPELTALQRRDGYLNENALRELGARLGIPLSRVYSVASFYHSFRFAPRGKHHIQVCVGAACYVKGAEDVYAAFASHLKIPDGADTSPDGLFTLDRVACLGCCMLAVAVQVDRHIFGHVTPDRAPAVIRDFLKTTELEKSENELSSAPEPPRSEIRVCLCSSCRAAGSARAYRTLRTEVAKGGLDATVKEVGCHGMSYRAPRVTVATAAAVYHYDRVGAHEIRALLANHFAPAERVRRVAWKSGAWLDRFYHRNKSRRHPSVQDSPDEDNTRLVTRHSGLAHPESLEEYRATGGFVAFEKAANTDPEILLDILDAAKLRGRGGGGFPTAQKWRRAFHAPGQDKVVVCNADEGDPGAFMDRMLLESYPYRVLEGVLIASRIIGARGAIIYIRDEYTQAVAVLERVIERLREAGYFARVGDGFDLRLFRGAGAFVCGEETALLESIEGRRGLPRRRPPFPVDCGLGGRPTLMNNVETFACVPVILADDGVAFGAVGTPHSRGTKAFALAGKIRNGGLVEVPIGIRVGDIVETYGGGAEDGHTIKAVLIGGPSGGCLPRRRFDTPVDYESLRQCGAMMGSGGLLALDERDCMVDVSLYYLRFLREESCGQCTLCREGVGALCDAVEQLAERGEKDIALLDRIETLSRHIQQGSLCALGRTAPNVVLSALHEFRSEFEAHIHGRCPAGKCAALTDFSITDDCIGCTKCIQSCAVGAIRGMPLEKARIETDRCVRCGVCRDVCPRNAIRHESGEVLESVPPPVPLFESRAVEGDFVEMDAVRIPFRPDRKLMEYARECGEDIPTLCYLKDVNETAHCQVCSVWDATLGRFVPACEQAAERGHVYETKGEAVHAFRREALSLLLDRHDFRCGTCAVKGDCRLFELVWEYRVKKTKRDQTFPAPVKTGALMVEAGKCILCRRCLSVSDGRLTEHLRAASCHISPAPGAWDDIPWATARRLDEVCPTAALYLRKDEP